MDQLAAYITDEVDDTQDWNVIREEPADYTGGKNLAIWWLGDEPFADDSTTGYLGLVDNYSVRYWEPAVEASRAAVDEPADVLPRRFSR